MAESIHPSLLRLLEAAQHQTAGEWVPVVDFATLAARMNVSSQAMTNWKARGLSKDGALLAEQLFGCFATWLLTGAPPARPAYVASSARAAVAEAPGAYLSPSAVLQHMGTLLGKVQPQLRSSVGAVLAVWASTGGSEDQRAALEALMTAPSKHRDAA